MQPILPKYSDTFKYELMKDSKSFSSSKKLHDVYNYILENATDYVVKYETEESIDQMNRRRKQCMIVVELIDKNNLLPEKTLLLIDGNYFRDHMTWNKERNNFECYAHECIREGIIYSSISASIIKGYAGYIYRKIM